MKTVLLLLASNTFMTMAWYGHLKYKQAPLLIAIAVSWLIALPEYILQVPANRIGNSTEGFSPSQLKIIQEVMSDYSNQAKYILMTDPEFVEFQQYVYEQAAHSPDRSFQISPSYTAPMGQE